MTTNGMTRTKRIVRFLPALALALASTAIQALPRAGEEGGGARAHQAFERLKSLAGRWEGTTSSGERNSVAYELASGGSVLLERLVEAEEGHETMLTAFHLDGNRLMLTHYCTAGNQPRMAARRIDGDGIRFEFVDATNLPDPASGHMHGVVYRIQDADHFTSEWTWHENGKPVQPNVMRFTRASR